MLDPTTIEAEIGESVNFRCMSIPPVQWILKGGEMGNNTKLSMYSDNIHQLTITDVNCDSEGQYQCYSELNYAIRIGTGILFVKGNNFVRPSDKSFQNIVLTFSPTKNIILIVILVRFDLETMLH